MLKNAKKLETTSISSVLKSVNSLFNPYTSPRPRKHLLKKPSKKSLTSRKESPSSKIKNKLISYQSEEISKLKQEKSQLQAYVLQLESKITSTTSTPTILKFKEKSSKRIKSLAKKSKKSNTISLSNSATILKETLNQIQSISSSEPISQRNSTMPLNSASLAEILNRTEKTLKSWKKAYYLKKISIK